MPGDDSELLREILDDLPVAVWVAAAPSGVEVYANARFTEIMGTGLVDTGVGGYSEPYGIHKPNGSLYPERELPFVQALSTRAAVTLDDIVIHRRDGGRVCVRAFARPLFGDDGEPRFVTIAFIDITAETEAKRAREQSEARALRAARMEAIGNLAGGIAHDFANLLSIIRTTSVLVEREASAERRHVDLALIREITDRAAELTRALLRTAGRGVAARAPITLREVVEGVAPIVRGAVGEALDVTLELGGERQVHADRAELEQVVMNLVLNARDAMPRGGKLHIQTGDDDGRSFLLVSDTGVGIPAELRDRVFEPYFTTKDGTERFGAGLGLATVYGICERHGGSVELKSTVGAGTSVRVTLPSAPATAPRAVAPSEAPSEAPAPSGLVLVVEDVEPVRHVTARALRALGYEVITAVDGLDAVDAFRLRGAELLAVVMDVRMPRLDGHEALAQMRAIDPRIPVVLLTALAPEETAPHEPDGLLAKPVALDDLARVLRDVIARRRP